MDRRGGLTKPPLGYDRSDMPTERVQRQIDALLDQAEDAVTSRDWTTVLDITTRVLSIDAGNEDALTF